MIGVSIYIWVAFGMFTELIWQLVRKIHGMFQRCWWTFDGTSAQIVRNQANDSYKGTTQVLRVVLRYKYDTLGQVASVSNFLLSHESFQDPEYVLNDNITLYYVNEKEAVLVESDVGADVSRCQYSAFIFLAQYKLAKKVIIIPIHVFHKLADKIDIANKKLIFLSNTARCGSTLVTRIFSEMDSCLSYSEPECLNSIVMLKGVVTDEERVRIFKGAVKFLCKPQKMAEKETFVLKMTQSTMKEIPHIKRLFPDAIHLFLYREGLAVARSLARCSAGCPAIAKLQIAGRWSSSLMKQVLQETHLRGDQFVATFQSDLEFGVIMWAAAVRQYLEFREQGIDIKAGKYEDIVKDPQFALQKIFEYCGLPYDASAVETGMKEDSQRDSAVSYQSLKNYKPDPFSDEVKGLTDKICDKFELPRLPNEFIADGTITTS